MESLLLKTSAGSVSSEIQFLRLGGVRDEFDVFYHCCTVLFCRTNCVRRDRFFRLTFIPFTRHNVMLLTFGAVLVERGFCAMAKSCIFVRESNRHKQGEPA